MSSVRNADQLDAISSLSDLETRLHRVGSDDLYGPVRERFGIDYDPSLGSFVRPALKMVEHPGCWIFPSHKLRAMLLQELVSRNYFCAESSGTFSLESDGFSSYGDKRWYTIFDLSEDFRDIAVLTRSHRQAFEHRTYSSITVSESAAERIGMLCGLLSDLCDAAAHSEKAFVEGCKRLRLQRTKYNLQAILPGNASSQGLSAVARRLRTRNLSHMARGLETMGQQFLPGENWACAWNSVNSTLLDLDVRPAGAFWTRMFLSVHDPEKFASALAEETGLAQVAVAAIPNGFGRRKRIIYNAGTHRFHIASSRGETPLAWEDLRESALQGMPVMLSALGSYLVYAAHGNYFLIDSFDRTAEFQKQIEKVLIKMTGYNYPWIFLRIPNDHNFAPWMNTFRSDYYADTFHVYIDEMISSLFESMFNN
jgi:hypothetical protein